MGVSGPFFEMNALECEIHSISVTDPGFPIGAAAFQRK